MATVEKLQAKVAEICVESLLRPAENVRVAKSRLARIRFARRKLRLIQADIDGEIRGWRDQADRLTEEQSRAVPVDKVKRDIKRDLRRTIESYEHLRREIDHHLLDLREAQRHLEAQVKKRIDLSSDTPDVELAQPRRPRDATGRIGIGDGFRQVLAKAAQGAGRSPRTAVSPDASVPVPGNQGSGPPVPDVRLGRSSLMSIDKTLQECNSQTQPLYRVLMEGWSKAGGSLQCVRAGRIYLKFETARSLVDDGEIDQWFDLLVLTAPRRGKRLAQIHVAWDLASPDRAHLLHVAESVARFQAVVSDLPGFEQKGCTARLRIGKAFREENAQALLRAALELKEAAGAAS